MRRWIVAVVAFGACFGGCTDNELAKDFGGTVTLKLKPGHKLLNVTWKESELWYLTRPMRDGEVPERYELIESSSFGVMEGKVILHESR